MTQQNDSYAVEIDVPGFRVRVRDDKTVVWLCTTAIFCCSVVAMMMLVFRQTLRA